MLLPALRANTGSGLSARIVRRTDLFYRHGASSAGDHPSYVRAASGLAWVGDRLHVVQDDVAVVAVIEHDRSVYPRLLPRGSGGRRRYEEALGNRLEKPDFEACCALRLGDREVLAAFGSGSTPQRRTLALLDPDPRADAREVDLGPLYDAVARFLPAGVPPNIEGVVAMPPAIRFLHRANGRTAPASPTLMADVSMDAFCAWVTGSRIDPPFIELVVQVDLGAAGTTPYSFSDATLGRDGRMLYLATAEDSPDAVEDGEVLGTLIGICDDRTMQHAPLLAEDGSVARLKAEGIALSREDPGTILVVFDPDDPTQPSQLCEVRLEGPW